MSHELQHTRRPTGGYEVHGKHICSESPMVLPSTHCIRCGSTEPGGRVHNTVLNYVSPWIWLTFFISGLITILAYWFTKKPLQIEYYLCPKCEDRRRTVRITSNLVMIISVIGMFMTVAGGPFEIFIGAMFLSLIGRAIFGRSGFRVEAHEKGLFSLRVASQEFLIGAGRKQLE